jgi:hypothetical protein
MSLAVRITLFVVLTSSSVLLYALPYLTIAEPAAVIATATIQGPA